MKTKSTLIIVTTVIMIAILSYQPPMSSYAQKPAGTSVKSTVKPKFQLKPEVAKLLDSIKLYDGKIDSTVSKSKKTLSLLKVEQKTLSKNLDTLTSITKNE